MFILFSYKRPKFLTHFLIIGSVLKLKLSIFINEVFIDIQLDTLILSEYQLSSKTEPNHKK